MTDITELAQLMKAAAVRAKAATEDYVAHRMSITVYLEECKEFNDLSDGPDNILALVEALEIKEEQRANWFQMAQKLGEDLDAAEKRNAELESSVIAPDILRCTECSFVQTKNIISVTADTITTGNSESEPCPNGCGQLQPVTWKALAIQLMFTTKQGVSDLLEAKKRIAELESRTVTVKLPPKIERDDADGWFMYKGGRVGGGAAEWYNKALDDVSSAQSAVVTVKPEDADGVREEGNQFLVVRHPGKVPVIKHPVGQLEGYLLQILKADPLATIDIVTHRYYGVGGQFVEDADEYLHEMGIKWEAE